MVSPDLLRKRILLSVDSSRKAGQHSAVSQIRQETLVRVAELIPHPSLALAAPAAVVLHRLADDSADDSERAGWLLDLSAWLADLGRLEEALAWISPSPSWPTAASTPTRRCTGYWWKGVSPPGGRHHRR